MTRLTGTRTTLFAVVLSCCRVIPGCGGNVPPAPERPAEPRTVAADPTLDALGTEIPDAPGVEAPAPPDGDAPAADAPAATTGAETSLPAADALTVCHCLTYPDRTGGTTVAIKDCFATEGECANARSDWLRRRGRGDPPAPACETESRPSCGQAVFGE